MKKTVLLIAILYLIANSAYAQQITDTSLIGRIGADFPMYSPKKAMQLSTLRNVIYCMDSAVDRSMYSDSVLRADRKYIALYDTNGLLQSWKYYLGDPIWGGGWTNQMAYYYTFYPDENLTAIVYKYQDNPIEQYLIYYNNDDKMILRIDSAYNNNNVLLARTGRIQQKYDNAGNIIEKIEDEYSESVLVKQDRTTFSYNTSGKLMQKLGANRTDTLNLFKDFAKESFYYSPAGNLDSTVLFQWSGQLSNWSQTWKRAFTTTTTGKITSMVKSNYIGSLHEWNPSQKWEYSYDLAGNPSITITYSFNHNTQSWIYQYKDVFVYDLSVNANDVFIPEIDGLIWQSYPEYVVNEQVSLEAYTYNGTNFELMFIRDFSYTGHTTGIETKELPSLVLYPNPATGEVTLSCKDRLCNGLINIYNLKGQLLLSSRSLEGIIDVSSLSSGIFVLETVIDKQIVRSKLMVN